MEDVKRSNIAEDSGNFSNSLLSVINKNAVNDTGNAANLPKIPVIVVSDSSDTEDSVPKRHLKFRMRINNSNEALFVILPKSIICLICYKKFLRISSLKSHILWHLHRDDVPSNNLCHSCKSNADISDCPSFKLIKKIMRNFLLSTIRKRQSLKNNSRSYRVDPNYDKVMITENTFTIENTTTETSSNNSHLDNNNSPTPSNTANNNKPKDLKDYKGNSIQDDLFKEKAVTSDQKERTTFDESSAVSDKLCVEPVIDSSEFMLVNGQYKCLSCSKDYTLNTINNHIMWHFHKGVDLCSKLHYISFSSGDTICPLVVQIINYLVSKEGKPIQVNWGKNNDGKIIFKVKLMKTATELNADTVVDNPISLTKKDNVPSFQSDSVTPPIAEYTINEPLVQDHSDSSDTQNSTCNSKAGSSHPTDKYLISECSNDTPTVCDKTDESLPLENDNQPVCKEMTEVTTAGTGGNNLHVQPVRKPDSSADVWSFYKCMVTGCNYSTLFPDNYLKHLKQLHENMHFYQCTHCDFTADTYSLLAKHLKTHTHPTEFLFPCGSSNCSYYTRVLSLLPKHFTSSHINCKKVLCKHCATEFTDLSQLLEHYHCNLLKSVKCSYCPARDTLRQRILHHLSLSHPGRPRQIIVSSQLVCSTKKQASGHVKLPTESTVKVMKETLISEQEQTAGFKTSCLSNDGTDDGDHRASEKYVNGLINPRNHTEELCKTGDWSNEQSETNGCSSELGGTSDYANEQCNGLSDFKQAQEQKGVKMKQLRKQKNRVKTKLKNSSKDISSIEGFNWSGESNGSCEQTYNNTAPVSNFINFDIAGRELDACLKICYEFLDQSLKCKLCFQTRKSTQEIHLHILQYHFHWYLWQCFKCKTNTYSLEEMHWHYQHKHRGLIICVKFLSLPQLAKGSDGRLCLQKEQKIVSEKSQKSKKSELYRQIRQHCVYEMVNSRNSKKEEDTANDKQRNKKLFIFLSDSQPLDEAEKIPDNDENTNNLAKGELDYEKNYKHKKLRKSSLNDKSHREIKKRKISSLLNESNIAIDTSNTDFKMEKTIKQGNNYNRNGLLLNVEKHLMVAQNSLPFRRGKKEKCLLHLRKETSLVNYTTWNQAFLTGNINTSFDNSCKMSSDPTVNNKKMKISPDTVEQSKEATGSDVKITIVKADSDVEISKVKTGSPVDNSKTRTGSPVDNSKTKIGSPVDNSKTRTGSPVDNSKTKTDSPVDNSKTKIGSPVNNSRTRTGSPVDNSKTKIGSPVDNSRTRTGSPVDNSKTKTGSPVDNSKTRNDSPVDNIKTRTDSPVDNSKTRTDSPVDNSKTKTGSPVDNSKTRTGAPVDNSKTRTGSPVDNSKTRSGSPVDNSKTKTGSPVDNSKTKTGSPVNNSKIRTDSPVDNSKTRTGSPVDNSKTRTDSPVDNIKTRTDSPVDNSETKTGSPVDNSKTRTGAPVDNSKTRTGSPVDNSKTRSGSPVDNSKTKTGSPVDNSKTKTGSPVNNSKTRTDSPVDNSKTRTGSPVDNSKTRTDSPVDNSKTRTDSLVDNIKTRTDSPVDNIKTRTDSPVDNIKTRTDSPVDNSKTRTDSPVDNSKTKTGSPVDNSKTRTGAPVDNSKTRTGSPVDNSKTRSCSPVDNSKTKTGSPVDNTKTWTDSPVDNTKTWTDSPVDNTKTRSGSHVDNSKTRSGSPVNNSKTRTDSPVDNSKTRTGSPVDSSKTRTGSPVHNSKTRSGSPVHNSKTKTGSPADSNNTKTSSTVERNKVKTDSAVDSSKAKANLAVDSSKVKTGSAVDSKAKTGSAVDSKAKTGSAVDSKAKTSSAVDSKAKTGSAVDSKAKTGSAVDSKAKTGSAVDSSKVKTGSDVDSKAKTGSAVDGKAKTGSAVDSKAKTGSAVDSKAKTGSAVDSKAKTGSAVDSKAKTGSAVDSSKVKTGSAVDSKAKTGSAVDSKAKTGSAVDSSKVKTGSAVDSKAKTGSAVDTVKQRLAQLLIVK
ncbi:uncharacterized protein LOC115224209 isoform X3 [Octopus sinensis]|uniref:Uncharacterized protein LOC115224209 isoform X3 n=1 Tax=Octopus sinensis TaxID=2607531 RepID=A0A7E6FP30_9MOLL|nr:uncharacterized protein LOC115224209 isoform X3 [Octopus sinensis]